MENDIVKNEELENILLNYLEYEHLDKETLKIILNQYIVLKLNWDNVKLIVKQITKGDNKQNENTSCKL